MFAVTILKSNIKRDPWPLISDPLHTYLSTSQFVSDQKITLQNIKNNTGGRYALVLRCTWR